MGNENHHHHQFYYHHHQKSTFLPMLCSRPSIKDVSLPRCSRRGSNRASASSADPLSPRIGCMGQVKRNNKIAGFPTSVHSHYNRLITFSNNNKTTISPLVKYSKLKSLFSGKNLTTTPSTTTSAAASSYISKQRVGGNNSKNQRCGRNRNIRNENNGVVGNAIINIDAMDPPLPVVKRSVPKLEEGSLWKRRSGGPQIKSLQLQQIIHHPNNICPQPTTV